MNPGVLARKRLVAGGGFALGCGCKDAQAVAVAASASSPCSGATGTTTASTATTATWRGARMQASASASASTGTLTVPSASSSSFPWEDADADAEADGDEVDYKREPGSVAAPSFSGLLRQLNELEQSVMLWARMKSPRRNCSSPPTPAPPPAPPLPSRFVQHRAVHSGDKRNSKEGYGNIAPPGPVPAPPPSTPLSRPAQHRALHSSDKRSSKEGHGSFSPPPSFHQSPIPQHRRMKSVDKVGRQEEIGDVDLAPPPPPPLPMPLLPSQPGRNAKTVDRGSSKGDGGKHPPPPQAPKHRKAKSCDSNDVGSGGGGSLDGSVAVVKQSEDPHGDFRRSMLNMIVENRIVTGDELRELLHRFLALNAPRHHDAILRAFAEIWDEVFAPDEDATPAPHREPANAMPPAARQRTPPRRRHPAPAWRF